MVLISLVNHPRAKSAVFPRKLHVVTAAAPPSPTVIANMEALGAEIFHVYGLTETYGPHSICAWHEEWDDLPVDERARKKARQGVPYIAAGEMRVVDDNMRDVPADAETLGEVVMRGNNVMLGYYQQPEVTAEAFRGGWFHSGDLAVMHPDGYAELRRPQKGHHHQRRREHLDHRGGEHHLPAPGRARGVGHRHPGREMGRGAQGVRRTQAGHAAERRPTSSSSAATTSRTSSARRRWSSATCRKPRPVR